MTRLGLRPLAIAWMAVLTYLSSLAPEAFGPEMPFDASDKVAHAAMYSILLFCFIPPARQARSLGEWLPFAIGATLVFASCDEFHQSFVAGRNADPLDFAADAGGVLAAALAVASLPGRVMMYRLIR